MAPLRTITFEIQVAYKPLNLLRAMHFAAYRSYRSMLAREIAHAARGMIPLQPFECSTVRIIRCSSGLPDLDGIFGSVKPLLDCLVAFDARRHPNGLGFIADDNPLATTLQVEPRILPRSTSGRTTIDIREDDPSDQAIIKRSARMGATLVMLRTMRLTPSIAAVPAKKAQQPTGMRSRPPFASPERITAAAYRTLIGKPTHRKSP